MKAIVLESFVQIFGIAGTYFSEVWQIPNKIINYT
jgi:hypothetical protein